MHTATAEIIPVLFITHTVMRTDTDIDTYINTQGSSYDLNNIVSIAADSGRSFFDYLNNIVSIATDSGRSFFDDHVEPIVKMVTVDMSNNNVKKFGKHFASYILGENYANIGKYLAFNGFLLFVDKVDLSEEDSRAFKEIKSKDIIKAAYSTGCDIGAKAFFDPFGIGASICKGSVSAMYKGYEEYQKNDSTESQTFFAMISKFGKKMLETFVKETVSSFTDNTLLPHLGSYAIDQVMKSHYVLDLWNTFTTTLSFSGEDFNFDRHYDVDNNGINIEYSQYHSCNPNAIADSSMDLLGTISPFEDLSL